MRDSQVTAEAVTCQTHGIKYGAELWHMHAGLRPCAAAPSNQFHSPLSVQTLTQSLTHALAAARAAINKFILAAARAFVPNPFIYIRATHSHSFTHAAFVMHAAKKIKYARGAADDDTMLVAHAK